ncbi:hypothetical protein Tco_1373936 [Tanacetum coccineum]
MMIRLPTNRQNWWKPLTEDRPATPEPAWSIPSSDLPIPVNNWASALTSTYAPPPENSLLTQTGDMAIFMDMFCKNQWITELKQQDLEPSIGKLEPSIGKQLASLLYLEPDSELMILLLLSVNVYGIMLSKVV